MINEIKKRLDAGIEVNLECIDADSFLNHKNGMHRPENEIILSGGIVVEGVTENTASNKLFIDVGDFGYRITGDELKYFRIKENKEREMSYSEKLINKDSKFQEMLAAASYAVARGKLSSFIVNDMDCSDKIGNALYLGLNMTYHAIENEIKGIYEMIDENKTVEEEVEEIKKVGFDDLIDVAVRAYKDGIADKLAIGFDSGIERVMLHVNGFANSYYQSSDISGHIEHINLLYNETFVIKSMEDIDNIKWDTAKAVLANECELDLDILDSAVNRNVMLRILNGATVTQQKGDK